jgi:ubiquinone/menaquinone biosynthesis C-methylase UbiE
MRALRVYWHILSSLGTALQAGKQADQIFRYYVLETMRDIGVFDFVKNSRTYGEILQKFGFTDNEYTREVMGTLVNDRHNVLTSNSGNYLENPDEPLPILEAVLEKTTPQIREFVLLAEGMSGNILRRMREEHIDFSDTFDQDDQQLLKKFNTVLNYKVYSSMRTAAFSFLRRKDREWLVGKEFLDVGCGAGRETAEIWAKFNGDIAITAIDPVSSLIALAQEQFEPLLGEISPDHPPVNESNRPIFREASATRIPFENDSFDAAFFLFVLHWTPDPHQVVREVIRVVKPGGLIFGAQPFKPTVNPYFNLVIRSNRNSFGFFWREEYERWYSEHGIDIEIGTMAGMFCARNTKT